MAVQTSEWEKAKITLENIVRFQNNLSTTVLYKHPRALQFAVGREWPDITKKENKALTDTLGTIYSSLFDDYDNEVKDIMMNEDIKKTLSALDAFAYPIIMGYANELGSFQNVFYDYLSYGNYIMFFIYNYSTGNMGPNAKLLYRLWLVRTEQELIKRENFDWLVEVNGGVNYLLCFEGTEVTPATKKQYEKKLDKELKKIQKEIEEFRKSNMN